MELSGKKTEKWERRTMKTVGKQEVLKKREGGRGGEREGRRGKDKNLYGEFICEASSFPSHE